MEELIQTNKYQTPLTQELFDSLDKEIQEQLLEFVNTVPYIRKLIAVDRPRAKDLPRDDKGRIIVDLTNPHILEDVDYFRPTALHYQRTGRLTDLRPNSNPNSEYGKWIREEIRRCHEGYVRPSDGEWVTGDMYFFLNYCPMLITQKVEGSKKGNRVWSFPNFWEGHYYKFHYIHQAREAGHHGAELAARSKGKSFSMAAMLAKRFIMGESKEVTRGVNCMATAYQKEYLTKDGLLNKFQSYIDFCAQNTQFPSRRLKSSLQEMSWKMGYIDSETGTYKGTLNEVLGVSSKDDESKLRGKRGILIAIEEFGTFPNLLGLYGTLRPSVEEGEYVYGMIYCQGTAGDDSSDFAAAQELMYNPAGYNIHPIPNIYDKEGQGRPYFSYFFPGYISLAGYYDDNGNSDVIGALISILKKRLLVKYNSTDINAITKTISEVPITPQEAIIRSTGSIFPITELTARLNEIDSNPSFYDDTYIGNLVIKDGKVHFEVSYDQPIRSFPTKDNKLIGALEIYEMPQSVKDKVPQGRYIVSLDNYENDESKTMSLGSLLVLDLWTDRIVAEYTGRPMFVDDLNEIARKVCLFYNAQLLYENNKKNTFSYFSKVNSLHLLADTPEYLKNRQLIKSIGYGNTSKGVSATVPIKNFGFTLIRDWLLKPVTVSKYEDGEEVQYTVPNLHFLKNRALIQELIAFSPDTNVDRIMSLVQLMLFREEKMILFQGNPQSTREVPSNYLGNDPFFKKNYDDRFSKFSKNILTDQ